MLEKLARLFSTFRSDKLFNVKLLDSLYLWLWESSRVISGQILHTPCLVIALKIWTKRVECRPVLWSRISWKARDLGGISFIRGENLDETVDLFFDEEKKEGNNRDLHHWWKKYTKFISFNNFIHFLTPFLFFFLRLKIFHRDAFGISNTKTIFFFSRKFGLVYHHTNFKSNYISLNF